MQSAFGIDHGAVSKVDYTAKEKKRIHGATAVGAGVGAAYLGGGMSAATSIGSYRARKKADSMKVTPMANPKDKANPAYGKYEKTRNLADRGSTEGERSAARGMADKLQAKHGFTTPKPPKLGAGYKTLRAVQHAGARPNRAMAVGFGTAAAIGGLAGNLGSRHNIKAAKARRRK